MIDHYSEIGVRPLQRGGIAVILRTYHSRSWRCNLNSFDEPHSTSDSNHTGRRLTDRVAWWWLSRLALLTGLLALAWFLIRVLPKPSRASYPCQRAAFPVASGFVLWLTGMLGAGVAVGKARYLLAHYRFLAALACMAVAGVLAYQAWNAVPDSPALAASYVDAQLPVHPIGTAKGIFPGRVTWVRNRDALSWDGLTSDTKGWWGTSATSGGDVNASFTDQDAIKTMVSQNLQWLTGAKTDAAAWTALFTSFNQQHSKGAVGYASGEKIFIKINFVTSIVGVLPSNGIQTSDRAFVAPSPSLAIFLERSMHTSSSAR